MKCIHTAAFDNTGSLAAGGLVITHFTGGFFIWYRFCNLCYFMGKMCLTKNTSTWHFHFDRNWLKTYILIDEILCSVHHKSYARTLACLAVPWYCSPLPVSFKVTSLAHGQVCDFNTARNSTPRICCNWTTNIIQHVETHMHIRHIVFCYFSFIYIYIYIYIYKYVCLK